MKKSVVPAIAGVFGVCMFANTASADFVGLTVELFSDNWNTADAEFPGNLEGIRDVWRIYAHFDESNDRMTAIGVALNGTAMTVENVLLDGVTPGSGLYVGFGSVEGPIDDSNVLWGLNPTGLTFDTYMTIGNAAGYTQVIDPKTGNPYFFGWVPAGSAPAWGDIPPNWVIDNAAMITIPPAPYGAPDGAGRVLIGQFNVADGEHIQGFANIQWGIAGGGGGGSETGIFFTSIPTPGALALLGLAGLAGIRRRRS